MCPLGGKRGSSTTGDGKRSVAAKALLLILIPSLLIIQSPSAQVAQPDAPAVEQAPASEPPLKSPPADLVARDNPNDNGHGVFLEWALSPDDESLLGYEIYRLPSPDSPESTWISVGMVPRGAGSYVYKDDNATLQGTPNPLFVAVGDPVHLAIRAVGPDGRPTAVIKAAPAVPRGNWFHTGKVNILTATLLFGFGVVMFILAARRGRQFYIRPIPGLGAVDEAIGRATEMGKPILFVLGTGTAAEIATIAAYTVLARVAKRTAEYQTPILVPVNEPVMLAMAQEVVRDAYTEAGRPDVYRQENISYISAMQFPYVAAVNGLMLREKTAANFYMGVFHAEALILAETGSVTGAIQISGTDQLAQIPFFVAATDYTLIGEELYAASAYLSQEPKLIGPLKAQDWTKIIILAIIVVGVLSLTFTGWDWILNLVETPV